MHGPFIYAVVEEAKYSFLGKREPIAGLVHSHGTMGLGVRNQKDEASIYRKCHNGGHTWTY